MQFYRVLHERQLCARTMKATGEWEGERESENVGSVDATRHRSSASACVSRQRGFGDWKQIGTDVDDAMARSEKGSSVHCARGVWANFYREIVEEAANGPI